MSNYPDDMRDEDIRYVEGTRAVDIAAEKYEDLSDEDQFLWWLFEDEERDQVIIDDLFIKLLEDKDVQRAIVALMKKDKYINKSYAQSKERWIEKEIEWLMSKD